MSRYADETREAHKFIVRECLVTQPRASLGYIIKYAQEEYNVSLSEKYVIVLKNKIIGERRHRYKNADVHERIARMRDTYEALQAEMWMIVLDVKASRKDKAKAAEVIAKLDKELLEAEMDGGVYERKIGTIDVDHNLEEFRPILDAFKNFGLIKPVKVIDVSPKLHAGSKAKTNRN